MVNYWDYTKMRGQQNIKKYTLFVDTSLIVYNQSPTYFGTLWMIIRRHYDGPRWAEECSIFIIDNFGVFL